MYARHCNDQAHQMTTCSDAVSPLLRGLMSWSGPPLAMANHVSQPYPASLTFFAASEYAFKTLSNMTQRRSGSPRHTATLNSQQFLHIYEGTRVRRYGMYIRRLVRQGSLPPADRRLASHFRVVF